MEISAFTGHRLSVLYRVNRIRIQFPRKAFQIMKNRWWILPAILIFDQLTKHFARSVTQTAVLIPGILRFHRIQNTGAAFSSLQGTAPLAGLLAFAVLLLIYFLVGRKVKEPIARTGFLLMIAGALSNLAERLICGSVTDMLEFTFVRFAIFNVADIAVVCGFLLIGGSILFRYDRWGRQA